MVLIQMWYRPWRVGLAYAESVDGIHWEKPQLGLWDADEQLLRCLPALLHTCCDTSVLRQC